MSESLNYIEAYFTGQLSDTERKQFEQQCEADEDFAADVAFYITSRQAVKEKLLEEKRRLWTEGETRSETIVPGSIRGKRIQISTWMSYAVAALLIFAVTFYFLNRPETPHQLADNYFKKKYTEIGQTMDAEGDSLQIGITAYNAHDYPKAISIFQNIYRAHPENSDAKMYTGIVYLKLEDYDKAIKEFDELAAIKGMRVNLGVFLKALTLMHRDKGNDRKEAKALLEEVVKHSLTGSAQAKEWLEDWKE